MLNFRFHQLADLANSSNGAGFSAFNLPIL